MRADRVGRRWRGRRRTVAVRGAPAPAGGRACRVRCSRTVIRARLGRSPAKLSGRIPVALSGRFRRARHRRGGRCRGVARRGRPAAARESSTDRGGRDPVDDTGCTRALARAGGAPPRPRRLSPRARDAAGRGARRRIRRRRYHRVCVARASEVRRLCGARGAGARRQYSAQPDRSSAAAVSRTAQGALSRLDRRALCGGNAQRDHCCGAVGVALEGLDRSPVHAQI